jgi:hypothetical protein
MPHQDLTNLTFNSWKVLHRLPTKRPAYLCECTCGTWKKVEASHLTNSRSKSCRPCSAKVVANTVHRTHSKSGSKVYRAWQSLKTRCYNRNAKKSYKYHGALGVIVCPEWLDNFEAFYAYVGDPPTRYHTIDRINPWGNYEPGNVRWATMAEQMANMRARGVYDLFEYAGELK